MSVNDHHTKFVTAYPLHGKEATEVLATEGVQQQIWVPKANTNNKIVQNFAIENDTDLKHGSP